MKLTCALLLLATVAFVLVDKTSAATGTTTATTETTTTTTTEDSTTTTSTTESTTTTTTAASTDKKMYIIHRNGTITRPKVEGKIHGTKQVHCNSGEKKKSGKSNGSSKGLRWLKSLKAKAT
ncbi:protein new-glue 3-like [Drosophila rhopaloa]|uniref:Protein new-glue 1-like n=1 Tax=Drosophila rhopaloa TaxID=1041015 RepID=A0ABM5HPL0_DRORH|nr:protein new-glue 3-like [Drosophila rhopaloa]